MQLRSSMKICPNYIIGLLAPWFVTFNPSKTESMIISGTRPIANYPSLVMNNQQIQGVESHKQMGWYCQRTRRGMNKYINLITKNVWVE